jgi:NDP-sugar pyrophosphorylase family protein
VYTPKPIVPVVNRPFLLYQIELLRRAGVEDITLSLNYQPDKIRHLLGDGGEYGVSLSYVTEPSPMGTAGAYRYAIVDSTEPTIVLNGDILTDLVFKSLLKSHSDSGAAATICVTEVKDPSRYGLVELDDQNTVSAFLEKPKTKDSVAESGNLINAGIYILEPEVLDLIPENKNCSFEYEVFPAILERNLPFKGYILGREYWCDIGTSEKYLKAHLDFLAGKVRRFDVKRMAETAEIATSSEIDSNSVIGEDCVIKPSARIINSVIGNGVHIEEKAVIQNSVIWSHSRISNSARVSDSIVAKSCYVGKNTVVGNGAVLGDKTSLTDYTKV